MKEISEKTLLLKGAQVWTPQERLERLDIGISGDKILEMGQISSTGYAESLDLTGLTILPGVIDTQVHFREPGRTHKEDLESGSRAAALGGVTAFFDMPNTSPSTTTLEALEQKISLASGRSHVDFAFYAGATSQNLEQLKKMIVSPGCCGIKIFMGSSTGDLLVAQQADLELLFRELPGPFAIHAEDEERLVARKPHIDFARGGVHAHELWRDEETAFLATQKIVALAETYQRWAHILHVSSQKEIEFLAGHKKYCTVELTPQHLTLEAPDCYDRLGTRAQMNPPIRSSRHRQALWAAVNSGVVDIIGSDHAPHTLEEKAKNIQSSPAGMPGVQTLLPIMLNHFYEGRLSLERLIDLTSLNPARLFKIPNRGPLSPGISASLSIVDLNKIVLVEDRAMATKCGWTPFNGMKVHGFPVMTLVRGKVVMRDAEIITSGTGVELFQSRL